MPITGAESRSSANDIRTRILRMPAEIRGALPDEASSVEVSVRGLDERYRLNIDASRSYLGSVTDLFRRVPVLRDGPSGVEVRASRVQWELDPSGPSIVLDITPTTDWISGLPRPAGEDDREAGAAILSPEQIQYLRSQAERFAQIPEWAEQLRLRAGVSERYRSAIAEAGILEGRELTREGLAGLVALVWEVQNLNAIVLPQLIGTYAYHRHFRQFEGSREDFVAHMEASRRNWDQGSAGYPGADPADVGRDLAAMLRADDEHFGPALERFDQYPGAGRALTSGLLLLWDPKRHSMVNAASVGPFEEVEGPLALPRETRARLRAQARERFGLPAGREHTKTARVLGWMLVFEAVREACGYEGFFEVDQLLWRLSSAAKGKPDVRTPTHARGGPLPVSDPTHDGTAPEDLAEATRERMPTTRVAKRREAAQRAHELIVRTRGRMTEDDLRELLRQFNVDWIDGRDRGDRFSPGFVGATANKLVDALDAVNEWIDRIWDLDGDALDEALTDAWTRRAIPSAISMLTMVLHVRDPERFAPVLGSLARGYLAMTGKRAARSGPQYQAYNEYARRFREAHGVSPYAVDVLFSLADRRSKDAMVATKRQAEEAGPSFDGFGEGAFEFLRDLHDHNNDTWYSENRDRFATLVREPMRKLVLVLGDGFIQAVDPQLERTAKSPQTLASIRKNAFGATTGMYWTHYWAAFHRRDRKKTEDFQLYVIMYQRHFACGMATGSANREELERLRERLAAHPDEALRAIEQAKAAGCGFRREDSGGDEGQLEVSSPADLAEAIATGDVTISRVLSIAETVARGAELAMDVERVFRAVYPLYVLATAADPLAVLRAYWDDPEPETEEQEPAYTIDDLAHDTLLGRDAIDELTELLEDKRQLVLYGPPGTGKTHLAERFARYFSGGEEGVWTVQFHPSYGYEDFIEGIRPRLDDASRQAGYAVVPGIFRRLCDLARRHRDRRFVLVVDEINRGNLPRIFGELLYLLERRGKEMTLPVSGEQFSVPRNVFLIGTMNTADHSIALVDIALRRRFHFMALQPDPLMLRAWLEREVPGMAAAAELLTKLNEELRKEGVDENLFIGHSHFMDERLDEKRLQRVWKHSILPTLEEYFYGKPAKLARFQWERFVDAELFEVSDLAPAEEDEVEEDDGLGG